MAEQKQDYQLEHTCSSYVRIQDVALKTCQRWWMIGKSGERGSGIFVLAARHDYYYYYYYYCVTYSNRLYIKTYSIYTSKVKYDYHDLLFESFSHQFKLMVFHWSLNDSKSPPVSRTFLSILAILNNVAVWMVSTCSLTSNSSSPFNNPLVTVSNAPITIGIIVTFMFHSFFNSLVRLRYLSFFSLSFSFILWSTGRAKSTILQVLFILLIIIRSGLLAEIRWSVCMSKSLRFWIVQITFVRMVKFKFLAHLPGDHLAHPVVSHLILLLCLFAAFAYYMIDGFVSINK